jgi:hypothetical protein
MDTDGGIDEKPPTEVGLSLCGSSHLIKDKESQKIDLSTGAIITPILPIYHPLPTELLAWIFKVGALMSAHREELPFPLLVSSINRHWRNIVINSPDVWTNVQWYVASRPFPAIWFERSKSCLLDITIHAVFLEEEQLDVSLLIPHIDRCHRFIIEVGDYYDLLELIRPLRDVFTPRLESIEVHVIEGDWMDDLMQQHFLTGGTPNLRSMRLRNVCLQYSPSLVGVQTLDLREWQPSLIDFHLLAAASSLTKLVLRECTVMNEDEEEYPVVEIPSLLSLAISHTKSPSPHSAELYQSLLKYLSLPNLEYLEIVHATVPDLIDHFPIDHQKLHYPKLQTLRLDSLHLAEGHMEYLLPRALPTVSHLQLINTEGERILPIWNISTQTSHEVASDTATTTESPRWPNLHMITLETTLWEDLAWLCDMVTTRIKMGKPLGRICFSDAHLLELFGLSKAWFEARVEVNVVGKDDILGIILQEDEGQENSELDRASDSQGPTAITTPSQTTIMANYPVVHQPTASTSAVSNLFPIDFIRSIASPPDEFDTSIFRPNGDINFERDFGHWFNPDNIGTITANHSDVHQPNASTSTAANLLPSDFQVIQSFASSLIESDPPIFRPDDDIDFERDFGQWFHYEDRGATTASHSLT